MLVTSCIVIFNCGYFALSFNPKTLKSVSLHIVPDRLASSTPDFVIRYIDILISIVEMVLFSNKNTHNGVLIFLLGFCYIYRIKSVSYEII